MASEESKINVAVAKDIEYLRRDVSEIKEVMKSLPGQYVTQKEHVEFVSAVDMRLKKLEEQDRMWKWAGPTLSAVLSSAVTFLVIEYLGKIK